MSDGDNITKLKFGRKSLRVAVDATFAVQFLHWLDHHPRGGEISVEQRRRVIAALLMPVPDDE